MSSEPECKGTPITLGVPNDGQHCACWYEGAACCRCEAPKLADDEEKQN